MGEPDGPASINRPSKARRIWSISRSVRARRGMISVQANTSRERSSSRRASSGRYTALSSITRSTASVCHSAASKSASRPWAIRSTSSTRVRDSSPASDRPNDSRSPGTAVSPPHSWRARSMASTNSTRMSPVTASASTCKPPRMATSLISHNQPSISMILSSNASSSGRSDQPKS